MSKTMIICGDVHGSYKTLMALMDKLPAGVPVCFVGDLIDRGPRSREVVSFVKHSSHLCVRGNHEQMMIEHVRSTALLEYKNNWSDFAQNGGQQTLASYAGYEDVMSKHVDWMEQLPYFLEFPEIVGSDGRHLVVSHSSVSPVWKWWKEDLVEQHDFEHQLLWNRHDVKDVAGIFNAFGHTPQKEFKPTEHYANIDTGACFKNREHYGIMTAYQFPEGTIYQQRNIEDE